MATIIRKFSKNSKYSYGYTPQNIIHNDYVDTNTVNVFKLSVNGIKIADAINDLAIANAPM